MDFQERVKTEKTELDVKLKALITFIDSSNIFKGPDSLEQQRLEKQRDLMKAYSDILEERILNFT